MFSLAYSLIPFILSTKYDIISFTILNYYGKEPIRNYIEGFARDKVFGEFDEDWSRAMLSVLSSLKLYLGVNSLWILCWFED